MELAIGKSFVLFFSEETVFFNIASVLKKGKGNISSVTAKYWPCSLLLNMCTDLTVFCCIETIEQNVSA